MKKINILIYLNLIFIFLSFKCFAQSDIVNEIVAVVNDEVITKQDLDKFFIPLKLQLESQYKAEELERQLENARRELLNKLIQDKLLLIEAEKAGLEVSEEKVEKKLKKIKDTFQSMQEFKSILAKSGMSEEDLKKRYREQFLIEKLINKEIRANIQVSPQEITRYYEENKQDFMQDEKVELKQIFITQESENAYEKAKMIKGLLDKGISFEELAINYSEGPNAEKGGLLGIKEKGELLPEIDEVIFGMKEGEVSEVTKTSLGYHIFKVSKKFPSGPQDLEEVRYEVKDILFREKAQEKFQNYLKDLYEHYYISFK